MNTNAKALNPSLRRHVLAVGVAAILLAPGLGGWAATTQFVGAVIAQGQLVVNSNVKKVQHPTGGVVGELRVNDGDRIRSGDIVVRLDDIRTRANLAAVFAVHPDDDVADLKADFAALVGSMATTSTPRASSMSCPRQNLGICENIALISVPSLCDEIVI
jgi:multidrug efflux pump subunit AcrA (membrane-fusion protein)